jgi:cytochrome c-type biogenesis protein CcmE
MNKIRQRRLILIGLFIAGLALASSLILFALKKNINVFLTPSEIVTAQLPSDYHFRLGGMVKKGSVMREKEGLGVSYVVTDLKRDITVHYVGVLPDLFHEGKGMIAQGHLDANGVFIASDVLAKHDENYMPKNVEKVIKANA